MKINNTNTINISRYVKFKLEDVDDIVGEDELVNPVLGFEVVDVVVPEFVLLIVLLHTF